MAKKDYYEILGVPKTASIEEIKKAYRKLAMKHHPDKGGNEEIFKEISDAYSILGDEEQKKKYDNRGTSDFNFYSGFDGYGMNDIFDQFFRNRGWNQPRQNIPRKGEDLRIKIELTLQEMFFGITKKIKYKKEELCDVCNGTGAANSTSIHDCPNCNGTGFISRVKQTIVGRVVSQDKCSNCGGTGKIIQTVCSSCGGKKTVVKEKTIEISIPKSIKHGDVISIEGAGNDSKFGGVCGNLLIYIEGKRHEHLDRYESDLIMNQEISICDAILGKEMEIEAIDGMIKIVIAPGTQSKVRLKIEGKGMYKPGMNQRGDMFIDVNVFIPKKISDEEKELFEKIRESENIKPKK